MKKAYKNCSQLAALKTLFIFSACTLLINCAATSLRPGAEKIIVSKSPAPKGCKFLGALVGEQGGAFTGGLTSNKDLAQGSLNDMRNKAFDLGANYVQLESETAGNTGSGSGFMNGGVGSSSYHQGQTDVTKTGNAYHCNPADIGL